MQSVKRSFTLGIGGFTPTSTQSRSLSLILAAAGVVAAIFATAPVSAEQLIYDGFGATEFGWGGGNWVHRGDTDGVVTFNPGASVDFSDYDDNFGTVGRVEFSIPSLPFTGNPYGMDRQFGAAPLNGATFYFSYVFQMLGEVDVNDLFDSGIAAAADAGYTVPGNLGGRILSAGIDVNDNGGAASDNPGVRLSAFGQSSSTLNAGTYLVIAKFSSTDADAAYEDAKMWALTPANYDVIKSGGITEAELDVNNVATASEAGDNPNVVFLSTHYHGIVARRMTGWYDELKYTTELSDVFSRPVPEPSGAALLACGLLALACRRRA